jgi:hypothetical protein
VSSTLIYAGRVGRSAELVSGELHAQLGLSERKDWLPNQPQSRESAIALGHARA